MASRWFFIILLCCVQVFLVGCSGNKLASVSKLITEQSLKKQKIVVKKGDNLTVIANRTGSSIHELAKINKLKPPYTIYAGQELYILTDKMDSHQKLTETHPVLKYLPVPKKTLGLFDWKWPVKGKVVENFQGQKSHNPGINIAGSVGMAVTATESGQVVYSGSGLKTYGKIIIIKHDKNYLSVYAYNSKLVVKEGQKVKKGQTISYMGKDEKGQNILHFEIRYKGIPKDPMKYLS